MAPVSGLIAWSYLEYKVCHAFFFMVLKYNNDLKMGALKVHLNFVKIYLSYRLRSAILSIPFPEYHKQEDERLSSEQQQANQ